MTVLPKLSAILLEIAQSAFIDPEAIPSSEAAHAALLFAQVAWNRTLGQDGAAYHEMLNVFLRSNPNLWAELRSCDPETLIEPMRQAKETRYPSDVRVIVVSGIREGNVHVEWCDEKDFARASKLAIKRLEAEYGPGTTIDTRRPPQQNIQPGKIGRNDMCYCGSGAKYKKCCVK